MLLINIELLENPILESIKNWFYRLKKKSNRKATNRNWSNQKANTALKTKAGNKYDDMMTDDIVQTGLCNYRHALQSSEFELKLPRDRQHALEREHLKYRLANVEQVNQQLNLATNMLLHNQIFTF